MAQILSASIYGLNGQSIGTAQGQTLGFPTQGILIRPNTSSATYNGVTCPTIIQLLPAGTKVAQDQYFCVTALATVITAANT
jgi:hypothetical protein